jgi:hypothetical protein
MDNFDLKKYLVENKVTRNSRMIKENEEDFSVELLVPTIYRNGETGELAETPAAFGARSELKYMDITNYSDGEELIEWVFDGSLEKAKYFEKEYPGLFRVVDGSKMVNEAEKKPTIKILKDLYYFDELGSLGAKDDVDKKYHGGASLVFPEGKTVEDDTDYDDSEYEMITSSERLRDGIDYKIM